VCTAKRVVWWCLSLGPLSFPCASHMPSLILSQNLVVPTARQYGLADEYEYLRPSIKQFPTGSSLMLMVMCPWKRNGQGIDVGALEIF